MSVTPGVGISLSILLGFGVALFGAGVETRRPHFVAAGIVVVLLGALLWGVSRAEEPGT